MKLTQKMQTGLLCASLLAGLAGIAPLDARSVDPSIDYQARLARGEIVVDVKNDGETKYVTGSCIIDQPAEKIWPIMVNPFEFKGKISPRMKQVEVVTDKANLSVLKVTMDMSFLFPNFTYVVESSYQPGEKISFHRVGGVLKDFRGSWQMTPIENGSKTELTYSMYLDTGFAVPQWLIREGVKGELPRTLKALRKRVQDVYEQSQPLEAQTILAAANPPAHHHVAAAGKTDTF